MTGTPKRVPGRKGTTKAERAKLPLCGAKHNKRPGTCKRPAGWGTDHPGEGRCKLHGGVGQKPSLAYQEVNASPRLVELIEGYRTDADLLNLSQDLARMRAIVHDYIERHAQLTDAIIAWHASHTSGYQEEVKLWRERLATYLEAVQQGYSEPEMDPPPPPIPEAFENKPRQLPDLAIAVSLIDKIGGMVERIQKREGERSIPLAEVDRVLTELGIKAVFGIKEVIPDDADLQTLTPAELRRELAGALERHWATVRY
ncbi:hypothetical protein [Deinococcus apachensis]|uniref:hypothetical protein n=1 Tax=Deinococcus apachensis TaxID=309886 RepID=UPI0012F914EE|nr:hypothetical protein [Deinococcus apachensis]